MILDGKGAETRKGLTKRVFPTYDTPSGENGLVLPFPLSRQGINETQA